MTRSLYGKRSVYTVFLKSYRLVNDVLIAALKAQMMSAQRFFYKLGKPRRRYGIGNNGAARIAFERNDRRQGDKSVSVYLSAVGAYAAAAVNVRVKYYAEVGFRAESCLSHGVHRRLVFGIRDMIREHTVRLQIAAAGCVRSEGGEYLFGVKSAYSVTCVNNDFQSL